MGRRASDGRGPTTAENTTNHPPPPFTFFFSSAETIRFSVAVRNASSSAGTAQQHSDRVNVTVTVLSKQPDCLKPNKVSGPSLFSFLWFKGSRRPGSILT